VTRCFRLTQTLDLSLNSLRDQQTTDVIESATINVTGTEIYRHAWMRARRVIGQDIRIDTQLIVARKNPDGFGFDTEFFYIDVRNSNAKAFGDYFFYNSSYTGSPLPSSVDTSVDLYVDRNIQCSPVIQTTLNHRVLLDPETLNYRHCRCVEDAMYWNSTATKCQTVEKEGVLFQYGAGVEDPLSYVKTGYYPLHPQERTFFGHDAARLGDASFDQCVYPNRCNPDEEVGFKCSLGYDPNSLMCSRCPEGMYPLINECRPCGDDSIAVAAVLAVLIVCALVLYIFKSHRRDFMTKRSFASVSIFLSWLQLAFVLADLSRNREASSSSSLSVFEVWQNLAGPAFQISTPSMYCINSDFTFISESWIILCGPWVFLAIVGCVWFVLRVVGGGSDGFAEASNSSIDMKAARLELDMSEIGSSSSSSSSSGSNKKQFRLSVLMYSAIFVINLMYMSVARRSFALLGCDELANGGGSYLIAAPYISCEDGSYRNVRVFAIVSIPLFVLGVPAAFSYLVYRSQRGFQSSGGVSLASIRMLSSVHKGAYPYWTVLVTQSRKCLVVLTISVLHPRNALVPFLVMVLLFVSLLLQVMYEPYERVFDNKLESVLLSLACLCYVAGFFASIRELDNVTLLYEISLITNIVVACGFVVLLPLLRAGKLPCLWTPPEGESIKSTDEDDRLDIPLMDNYSGL